MKTIVPVVTAVVALALVPASAAPRHHKRHANVAAQPQIACTIVGCMPVPRSCHPEMGYKPDGTPTGFDVVVCPNYTLYGNHR